MANPTFLASSNRIPPLSCGRATTAQVWGNRHSDESGAMASSSGEWAAKLPAPLRRFLSGSDISSHSSLPDAFIL
ncbi:hypothetical protein VTK26DRAFT_9312 [Humicola hyalothermophila]